jgi:DNA-binding Lrp family transcriptional regulator
LSVDQVTYRIKQLQKKKIISGFSIQLNYSKLKIQRYSVYIRTHNFTEKVLKKMQEYCKLQPNIIFMVTMIGNYDLSIEIETKEYEEINEIVRAFRQEFQNTISDFEIIHILDELKFDFFPFEV